MSLLKYIGVFKNLDEEGASLSPLIFSLDTTAAERHHRARWSVGQLCI